MAAKTVYYGTLLLYLSWYVYMYTVVYIAGGYETAEKKAELAGSTPGLSWAKMQTHFHAFSENTDSI
jgi:hypothetical protein